MKFIAACWHLCNSVNKAVIVEVMTWLVPVWSRNLPVTWTSDGPLRPLGPNFNEIWIQILKFSVKKMLLSAKQLPFLYPSLQQSWKGGILVSPCPSVHLWTESCLLCIFNNTCRIHFIFAHHIKQLEKVCHVNVYFNINFDKFFKCVTLTLSSFDLGSNMTQ